MQPVGGPETGTTEMPRAMVSAVCILSSTSLPSWNVQPTPPFRGHDDTFRADRNGEEGQVTHERLLFSSQCVACVAQNLQKYVSKYNPNQVGAKGSFTSEDF